MSFQRICTHLTFTGVAPGASLAAGKVLNAAGSGSDSDIVAGIEWCTSTVGAHVVNMSLGGATQWPGTCDWDAISQAVNASTALGVTHAVASGNDGAIHGIGSPACARRAIAVGAVYDTNLSSASWCANADCSEILCTDTNTQPDTMVCFSNGSPRLNIVAPGSVITSASAFSSTFVTSSGTSMATPHVAGLIARLLGERPELQPNDVAAFLARNSDDLELPGFDDRAGHGRINSLATVSDLTVVRCTTATQCDDGDPCTVDGCFAQYCTHLPLCDDGDACTHDTCDAGACDNSPLDLDDGSACTTDTCDTCFGPVHAATAPGCNPTCSTAIEAAVGTTITGDTTGATADYDTLCSGWNQPGADVVYRVHLRPEQAVTFRLTPTAQWDAGFHIFMDDGSGSDCDPDRCVGGADSFPAGQPEELLNLRVPVAADYYVVVDAFNAGDAGPFTLEMLMVCDPDDEGRPCDDASACTFNDRCQAGVCIGDTQPQCDDDNLCTTDTFENDACVNTPVDCTGLDSACTQGVCNTGTGACEALPAAEGAECDDGDSCTDGSTCQAGSCTGGVDNCDDVLHFSFKATTLSLFGLSAPATDEDVVTYDGATYSLSVDGSDIGIPAGADVDALAILPNGDMLLSFQNETIIPGLIGGPNGDVVDDSDLVTLAATQLGETTAGTVSFYFDGSDVSLTANGEDIDAVAVLDDGDLLISTVGNPGVGVSGARDEDLLRFTPTALGANTAGSWAMYFDGSDVGLTVNAEDVDSVTILPGGDLLLSTNNTFVVPGLTGEDEDAIRFTPTSLGGNTAGTFTMYFDGSANGFTQDMGGLDVSPLPTPGCDTDAECDDFDPCNGDETCDAGACVAGTPLDCDDQNPCTTNTCSSTDGCETAPVVDDTPCADADLCDGTETCQAGVCTAGTPLTCNDSNPCTDDACDPATGCTAPNSADDTPCPDADVCNGDETCQGGTCTAGTPLTCPNPDACHVATCDSVNGCEVSDAPNGTACPDGDLCNGDETCQGGHVHRRHAADLPKHGSMQYRKLRCDDRVRCDGRGRRNGVRGRRRVQR